MGRLLGQSLRVVVVAPFVLCALAVGVIPSAARQDDADKLTGSYLLDTRPVGLMFLSLTQTGAKLGGYTILVEPDTEEGAEGELKSRQLGIEGTADGGAVVLNLGDWWNGQSVLTGRNEGANLVLTYPTEAGQIQTAVFVPASPDEFNRALAEWEAGERAETELRGMLPTEEDTPPGLIQMNEYALSLGEVVELYADPGLTEDRLAEWGWQGAVTREFATQPALSSEASLTSAWATIHRFRSPEAAEEALDAFAGSPINDGLDAAQVDPLGDEARALAGPAYAEDGQLNWRQAKVYARTSGTVVLVAGESLRVDPVPLVGELAARVLDPQYAAAQSETATAIPELSQALADRISELNDGTAWFPAQTEQLGRDLNGVQSGVGKMGQVLGKLRERADLRPMDCFRFSAVKLRYSDLEFHRNDIDYFAGSFDAGAEELSGALTDADDTVAAVRDAADALANALEASPYPPPALDTQPGDEAVAVSAYEKASEAAQADLDALEADYTPGLTTADDLMTQGYAVLEETEGLAEC